MLGTLLLVGGAGLAAGALWRSVRTGHAWRTALEACHSALGGEITPGSWLNPPSLWIRTDQRVVLIELATRRPGQGRLVTRVAQRLRTPAVATRLSVESPRFPIGLTIEPRRPRHRLPLGAEAVTTAIAAVDRLVNITGDSAGSMARFGADRRPAIVAAVRQGAILEAGVWTIERPGRSTRAAELVGLARLLLGAADATDVDDTGIDACLYASVGHDPEVGFRLRCYELLTTRSDPWRARAHTTALADPSPKIRLRAAQAAGDAGVDALAEIAVGQYPEVLRTTAVGELGAIDHPSARAALDRVASSGSVSLKQAALAAMSRMGFAPRPLLDRLCRHPDAGVRRDAMRAIGGAGTSAEEIVLRGLDDTDPGVVEAAIGTLEHIGGEEAGLVLTRRLIDGRVQARHRPLVDSTLAAIRERLDLPGKGTLALAGADASGAGRVGLAPLGGALSRAERTTGHTSSEVSPPDQTE